MAVIDMEYGDGDSWHADDVINPILNHQREFTIHQGIQMNRLIKVCL